MDYLAAMNWTHMRITTTTHQQLNNLISAPLHSTIVFATVHQKHGNLLLPVDWRVVLHTRTHIHTTRVH